MKLISVNRQMSDVDVDRRRRYASSRSSGDINRQHTGHIVYTSSLAARRNNYVSLFVDFDDVIYPIE